MTCTVRQSAPSGVRQGDVATVTCGTGEVLLGCSVFSEDGQTAGAMIDGKPGSFFILIAIVLLIIQIMGVSSCYTCKLLIIDLLVSNNSNQFNNLALHRCSTHLKHESSSYYVNYLCLQGQGHARLQTEWTGFQAKTLLPLMLCAVLR